MWFKNLRIYRFTKPFTLTPEDVNDALKAGAFTPCNSQDISRYGWVTPSQPKNSDDDNLVHASQGYLMVCAKKQEKVLPAAVINEALEEKIAEISASEGRSVYRKERQTLKEDVIMTLLPRAFTRSALHFAYIAPEKGYIVINAASANKAEELLNALRDAIGSLPVVALTSQQNPVDAMTQWIMDGSAPQPFELGEECELADPQEAGSVIRCKHQDLRSTDIINHVKTGMKVTKLALNWSQGIDVVLDEQLAIKRLRFADEVREKVSASNAQDTIEEFDIEFSVMTLELSALIDNLLIGLGGVNLENQSVEEVIAQTSQQDTPTTQADELRFTQD